MDRLFEKSLGSGQWGICWPGYRALRAENQAQHGVFKRKPAPHLDSGMGAGSRPENTSKQETLFRAD
jgi:hypothetical protein